MAVNVVDWAIQRCKGEESLRSTTGHSVTQASVLHAHRFLSQFYSSFSPPENIQTLPSPSPARIQTRRPGADKKEARRAVDRQHWPSYGIRHNGARNTAPPPLQSPFPSTNTADTHFCLVGTSQPSRTPALTPPEKEGVPIV